MQPKVMDLQVIVSRARCRLFLVVLWLSSFRSRLQHVEVSYAGQGRYKGKMNATSAVESVGVPPEMADITVHNSAYNGEIF